MKKQNEMNGSARIRRRRSGAANQSTSIPVLGGASELSRERSRRCPPCERVHSSTQCSSFEIIRVRWLPISAFAVGTASFLLRRRRNQNRRAGIGSRCVNVFYVGQSASRPRRTARGAHGANSFPLFLKTHAGIAYECAGRAGRDRPSAGFEWLVAKKEVQGRLPLPLLGLVSVDARGVAYFEK